MGHVVVIIFELVPLSENRFSVLWMSTESGREKIEALDDTVQPYSVETKLFKFIFSLINLQR